MSELVQIGVAHSAEPPLVLVRGYLNDGDGRERVRWIRAVRQFGHRGPIFELDWDASSKVRFAANVVGFRDWRNLKLRAKRAGRVDLPRLIEQSGWSSVILVGASAGARIVYHALGCGDLASGRVQDAILLGAAIKRSGKKDWDAAAAGLSGKLVNVYSRRDAVLTTFYRAAARGAPCGTGPITGCAQNVINLDVTDLVRGGFLHLSAHARYHRALANRVRDVLRPEETSAPPRRLRQSLTPLG